MVAGNSLANASPDPAGARYSAQTGLLEALLSSPYDPVLLLDEAGKIEAYNGAAEAEFGLQSRVGWPAAEVEKLAPLLASLGQASDHDGAPASWQSETGRWFLVLTNPAGRGSLLISLRDITEWRHLNAAQGDVMHVVSHDLRTPLTTAKGLVEMMVEGYFEKFTPKQKVAVDKLALSIYSMVGVLDNLQDAGRFDPNTGFYKFEAAAVDLGEIAAKIVSNQQLSAEIQGIGLTLTLGADLPIIMADRVMMESALGNLVDNAIKFSEPDTSVAVILRAEGRNVLFSVSDSGPGIAAEDQERIFERSVRVVKQGSKRVRGSGLGLYIVRNVAQRHGGAVWVESVPGEGSTFFMRIPVRAVQPGR